jgi:predicted MFS family arabinose efflux permease
VVGALIGVAIGLLWHWLRAELFLVIGLAVVGFVIGKLLESDEIRERIRDLFSSLYR